MRNYSAEMDRRMFDFETYYRTIAEKLPNPCRLVEVGVANGASAIFMAETLLNLGKEFSFCLVDDFSYGGDEQRNDLMAHLGRAKLWEHVKILSYPSLEASCHFPDHLFDFVFIDASHKYEETKADIRLWYHKVIDEGVLAGHDYHTCKETKKAVHEIIPSKFLESHGTSSGFGVWFVKKNPDRKLN